MRRLLSLDPGQATGWSSWVVPDDAPMLRTGYGLVPGGIVGFTKWWWKAGRVLCDGPHDVLVCERFEQEPVKIEGLVYGTAPNRVIWQRNDVKPQVPDALLKEHGLWITGKPVGWKDGQDVNDAQRHALAWGKFDHLPTLTGYWPE
jgi:hypothetical protein